MMKNNLTGIVVRVRHNSPVPFVSLCLCLLCLSYDGHTLSVTIEQISRLSPNLPDLVFVDRGYRGHDYEGDIEVHVDKVRRGRTKKSLWGWMKRRAAIEPSIGHLKSEHRMDRNRLRGKLGDQFNAILSAAGMNFSKLLKWLEDFFVSYGILPGGGFHFLLHGQLNLKMNK